MELQKIYRAIFFDAGGTLFAPHPSVGEIYTRIAGKHGMKVNAKQMETLFREEFGRRDKLVSLEAHSNEKNEKEWWKKLVCEIFSKVTTVQSFDSFFEELYDLFASAEVWKLYPDVTQTLDSLKKQNITLGIVSNWDSRLFSICRGMGLDKYFDFILASAVVGSAKPDSGIFKEALQRAKVSPDKALHIGDSLENDVWGAKRAGIDALLINRNGRAVSEVDCIMSLNDLISINSNNGSAMS